MTFEKQLKIWDIQESRDEPTINLPAHHRFPHNLGRKNVQSIVFQDLLNSQEPLIISGYTSLSMIIEFLSQCYQKLVGNDDAFDGIHILIGNEPTPTQRTSFRLKSHDLAIEVQRYWLEERGISIFQCAKVIIAIDLLRRGKVKARLSDQLRPMHAKIFRGDNAVTLGSSNFSHSGLVSQYEANCRFQSIQESTRFREACQIADSYWQLGKDYQQELIDLLELLLSVVTWKEALSRACAELLEGEWAARYTQYQAYSDEAELWPSQQQGIAHALWVIENVGSVLIADATGSGKTKTGAHLMRSVMQKMWSTGRVKREIPVLLCPPNVEDAWREEAQRCSQNLHTCSHGILSYTTQENREHVLKLIRRAQVLAIDEAHRFLNATATRTQHIFKNIADHVLLFTATPINKGPQDLIAIVELLGADNFDDDLLDILSRIRRQQRQGKNIEIGELEKIQQAIQRFTVRRTKKMLNRMIDGNPKAFKNKHGQECRYPRHISKVYSCDRDSLISQCDRQLADQIRQTATHLKGVLNFQKPIVLPKNYGGTLEQYLQAQLNSAPALAIYRVMSSLRSSRICLLETIWGTQKAKTWGEISINVKQEETGNVLSKLHKFAGHPVSQSFDIPGLPEWLSHPEQHVQVCNEEIRL